MKCPYCDAWSSVLETRGDRRRRECANGHKFSTYERLATQGLRTSGSEPLADRDRQIVKAYLAGGTMTQIAAQFGLANHGQVSRVIGRALDPGVARSLGQTRRHRRNKDASEVR